MSGKLYLAYRWSWLGAALLLALAGCGRNYFFAEREPWRREAEIACLKSGTVKESEVLVRRDPIDGPGMCGADFPLKVSALGESSALMGYAGNPRPPAGIPGVSRQPDWPIAEEERYSNPYRDRPAPRHGEKPIPTVDPRYRPPPSDYVRSAPLHAPMSIDPNEGYQQLGAPPTTLDEQRRNGGTPVYDSGGTRTYEWSLDQEPVVRSSPAQMHDREPMLQQPRRPSVFDSPDRELITPENDPFAVGAPPRAQPARREPVRATPVPLGTRTPLTASAGPVAIKPAATLACPIVSALDRWLAESVQPAAYRWFGQPVAEIRQISAYSCRGMNGQRGARISEHAFGNALDIASFVLADGTKITVKNGWKGTPEEQGFLRDVQGAACDRFTTVLAPGSNRFHYDHIHVDLMRRSSGRSICNPDAVDGEVIAARAAKERGYALRRDPAYTGSIKSALKNAVKDKTSTGKRKLRNLFRPEADEDDWIEDEGPRPSVD
jgi:hypothetical protein